MISEFLDLCTAASGKFLDVEESSFLLHKAGVELGLRSAMKLDRTMVCGSRLRSCFETSHQGRFNPRPVE